MCFLPFIGIILDTVVKTYSSEDVEEAGNTSIRLLEVEFFIAFFVVMISGVPAIPLVANNLSFTPKALIGHPAQSTVTPANSQTTYGGSISFTGYPNKVDVPVFWYMVLGFSSGFNRAVMEDVPATLDLREYANGLRDIKISDPAIQNELNDFYRDCFTEARSKYLLEKPNSLQVNALLSNYGKSDPEWIGSHVYLEVSGYYDSLRSHSIREGFLWSQLRDIEWETGDHPIYGKPFCQEWWIANSQGLARKILDQADGMDLIAAAAEPGWDSIKRRDAIIKAAMLNSPPRWTTRGYDLAYGNLISFFDGQEPGVMASIQNATEQGLSAYGLARESISFAAYLRIFLESAPMIQALILMGLYALMPFFILMSRYKLSILIIGALILFIVKFWSVMWFFSWWVDQNLIKAFYPDPGSITTLLNTDMTLKRIILNFLTGALYVAFPFLFSIYLSFAGIHAARSLDGASGSLMDKMSNASRMNPSMRKMNNPFKNRKKSKK